jgi:putative transposase
MSRQAELLNISRGTVYYLPKPVSQKDLTLMNAIDVLHLDFPFMGARQLRRDLIKQDHAVGRLQVRSLMLRMDILALAPQPGTSQRNPQHKVFSYLLRKLAINRSNQVWALDTTYIRIARGFVYLTTVVDMYSRRILAHRTTITLGACHAFDALEEAYSRFGKPEIVNTDQGSQFKAQSFVDAVLNKGVSCPWTAAAPGETTCLLNACGERSSTSECIFGPTTSLVLHARTSRSTSIGTTRSEGIRV